MIEPKLWMKMGYLGELLSLKLIAQGVPLVSVSEFTSRNVRKIAGKGSRVVYPGVDISTFKPPSDKTLAKQKLGLEHQFIVLYVGRVHPYKDPMTLVRAMNMLPRDLFRLIIVGEGPLLRQVQTGLEKFDVNYDHLPRLDVSDLVSYYQASDAFVLPSLGEAAGIVFIEAMSCGLPLIVFKVISPSFETTDSFPPSRLAVTRVSQTFRIALVTRIISKVSTNRVSESIFDTRRISISSFPKLKSNPRIV